MDEKKTQEERFERWCQAYAWKESRRGDTYSWDTPRADIIPYSWEILPKRNGKFYLKAYLPGGQEARLPFQDFASIEEAKIWAMKYDFDRQERAIRDSAQRIIL